MDDVRCWAIVGGEKNEARIRLNAIMQRTITFSIANLPGQSCILRLSMKNRQALHIALHRESTPASWRDKRRKKGRANLPSLSVTEINCAVFAKQKPANRIYREFLQRNNQANVYRFAIAITSQFHLDFGDSCKFVFGGSCQYFERMIRNNSLTSSKVKFYIQKYIVCIFR